MCVYVCGGRGGGGGELFPSFTCSVNCHIGAPIVVCVVWLIFDHTYPVYTKMPLSSNHFLSKWPLLALAMGSDLRFGVPILFA